MAQRLSFLFSKSHNALPYIVIFLGAFWVFRLGFSITGSTPPAPAYSSPNPELFPYSQIPVAGLAREKASEVFRGKPLFVINASVNIKERAQLIAFVRHLATEPLSILVMSNSNDTVQGPQGQGVYFAARDTSRQAGDRLGLTPTAMTTWLLYDRNGQIRGRGISGDTDTLTYFVTTVVDAKSQYNAGLIMHEFRGNNRRNKLAGIIHEANKQKNLTALLLVEKFATGCSEIENARTLKKYGEGKVRTLIVPLGTFTTHDAAIVSDNMQFAFGTARPSAELQKWWSSMRDEYGVGLINGSVIFVDDTGVVGAAVTSRDVARFFRTRDHA